MIRAAAEHPAFEWFFLIVDIGTRNNIWARHGLEPEFVPAVGSADQLMKRVDEGISIGLANTAEVLLARAGGTPVKVVAGYFGATTARIFSAANGAIRSLSELDGRKVGVIAKTHTSYRAVLYLNRKLGISAEPVVLGSLQGNVDALRAGRIDAFYSAEGAALGFVDSGALRLTQSLADIYPKPYTAVVVWATESLIAHDAVAVAGFVAATLETVEFIRSHPGAAADAYMQRSKAGRKAANRAVAALAQVLAPSGRGSGADLVAAVAGNWQFVVESGMAPPGSNLNLVEAVDTSFLPALRHARDLKSRR